MTVFEQVRDGVAALARLRRIELRPEWSNNVAELSSDGRDALGEFVERINWAAPIQLYHSPRANEFPLMLFDAVHGWAVAERMEGERRVTVLQGERREQWLLGPDSLFFDVAIPEPPAEKRFKSAFHVFLSAIFARKKALIIAMIATITINLIALGTSLYTMQVYDRVIPRGSFATLWTLTVGVGVALFFDFVLKMIRSRLLEAEAAKIDSEVSEFFLARAVDVRLDARPPSVGTMAAQLKGLEQIRSTMSSATIFAMADLPFAFLFIFIVAQLGGIIAVVTLISFLLAIGIAFFLAYLIRQDTQKVQVSGNKKNGLLVEALDAAETIKANSGHWYLLARWNALISDLHKHELPVKDLQALASSTFGTIQQSAYIALIAWGSFEVYNNNITMGALIACSILAGRINGSLIGQLPSMVLGWTYSKISLGMLDSIMQLPGDRPEGTDPLRPSHLKGSVKIQNVQFVHQGARSGLNVPTLEIKPGERVGVIGGIGSGKSTLLRLIAGLYAPTEGRVLLNGLESSLIAGDILRDHIGYLPQDYRLVNGTLRDNLLLGLADPGTDAIMAAAEATGLSQLIAGHSMGLDLPIGEGGRGLSGGQRGLTGLTRLMLMRPSMWLLDEPTANLDVDTEARFLKSLQNQIRGDDTLILVTHKIQLLNLVQRVLVLANGQIVLDGPTKEVVARLSGASAKPAAKAAVTTVPAVVTV